MSTTNILDLNNRIDELEKNSGGGGSADSAKRSDIATEFSTETNYTAGNFVYYEGKLYQFNADHSAGAWDPTDVVEANVTDQVVSNYNTFKNYTEKSDIAPTFSDANSYNKGDLVYYGGTLYQFTADHTAGAWTGTDTTTQSISSIIEGSLIDNGVGFKFGYDDITGKYGYYKNVGGTDTFTPFEEGARQVKLIVSESGSDSLGPFVKYRVEVDGNTWGTTGYIRGDNLAADQTINNPY